MKSTVIRHVYGTWSGCMAVLKKTRMKNRKKDLRLYDRYDVEQISKETMKEIVDNRRDYKAKGRYNLIDGILGSKMNDSTMNYDEEYFHMTLYKDV